MSSPGSVWSKPTYPNAQLRGEGLGFAFGGNTILEGVDMTLAPGDRLGLVGPNGCGKSTLLSILAGLREPMAGTVSRTPESASVTLMRQQLDDQAGETIAGFLLRVTGIRDILSTFEQAAASLATGTPESADRYDRALQRFVTADAGEFDQRCEQVIETVGLHHLDRDRRVENLSGGERTKVGLAAILLAQQDILLLDEPTNDLDWSGLDLLEELVVSRPGAFAIVSHDRNFLERVTTAVFEFDDHRRTGTRFEGGYLAWQTDRQTARRHHREAFEDYQSKRQQLAQRSQVQREWSDQGTSRAKKDFSERDKHIRRHRVATSEKVAAKAKQTDQAINRLVKVDKPWEPWELRLQLGEAGRAGEDVAVFHSATVERKDFKLGPIDAVVKSTDRILITGDNGSGKTTLLDALLGDLPLSGGTVRLGRSVIVGRLDQQRRLLEGAGSIFSAFQSYTKLASADARSLLAKLGLSADKMTRTASELSPGEQTRAALAAFSAVGTNLLVLDEPTNHLDLPAIEQLELAIGVFPHTVILVTHDRALIEAFESTRTWTLRAGQLSED